MRSGDGDERPSNPSQLPHPVASARRRRGVASPRVVRERESPRRSPAGDLHTGRAESQPRFARHRPAQSAGRRRRRPLRAGFFAFVVGIRQAGTVAVVHPQLACMPHQGARCSATISVYRPTAVRPNSDRLRTAAVEPRQTSLKPYRSVRLFRLGASRDARQGVCQSCDTKGADTRVSGGQESRIIPRLPPENRQKRV